MADGKPKLDIVTEERRANDSAIELLEKKLAEIRDDPDVTGAFVIVERPTGLTCSWSYSPSFARRIGLLETLKAEMFYIRLNGGDE